MRRHARLYAAFVRNCLAKELEYRTSFVLRSAGNLLQAGLSILFLSFVFRHVKAIAGWTVDEGILLTGTFLLLQGTMGFVFSENMERISQYVNRGELDLVLTKPVNSLFYVSTRIAGWDSLPKVILGAIVIPRSLASLGIAPAPLQIGLFLLLLVSGMTIGFSLWILSVVYVFWSERLRNAGFIFYSLTELGRVPIQVFKGIPRAVLTFVLPIAFMTTVPTQALLGLATPAGAVLSLSLAATLLACAVAAWRKGLRAYSSASS